MKRKIANCIITVQIIMSCFAFESAAFNDSEAGAYLWRLINEARAKPAKTIQAYDIDYESARRALGKDVWILELENGLPPLAWNTILEDTSSAHNTDMINRQYYSYTSPEGLSFNDRIVNSGYNPIITGESLGILSFYIYVDPIRAIEDIFENMLRDELNPELGYKKNIFNKDFTEVGIAFISTIFSFNKDSSVNAYLITADFGKPVETRNYILGNIYTLGENEPNPWIPSDKVTNQNSGVKENQTSGAEENYAIRLLSYTGWAPKKSNENFTLWVNNFSEGWGVEVSHRPLGTYQIKMPANTFYSIELYDPPKLTLLKRIVNIGLNFNKLVDFVIH